MHNKPLTPEQIQEAEALKAIFDEKKKALGISQETVATDLDITQAGVSHYLNARNPLNLKVGLYFAKILQVPLAEFSPRLDSERQLFLDQFESVGGADVLVRRVPLIAAKDVHKCDAGDSKWINKVDVIDWLHAPFKNSYRSFCVEVTGSQMQDGENGYPPGAIILVDPEEEPGNNSDVIVVNPDNSWFFRRLERTPEGDLLVALNKNYPDRILKIDKKMRIAASVIGYWLDTTRIKN